MEGDADVNPALKTFIGPVAQYRKNDERPFWQDEPLGDLFSDSPVFVKLINNS